MDPLDLAMQQCKRGLGQGRHHHHHHHKHKHKHKHGAQQGGVEKSKRSRGGERSRRRKHAAASRANKEQQRDQQQQLELQTGSEGLFAFINQQIGDHSEAAGKIKAAGLGKASEAQAARAKALWGGGAGGKQGGAAAGAGGEDRRSLLSKQDNITAIKVGREGSNEILLFCDIPLLKGPTLHCLVACACLKVEECQGSCHYVEWAV